MEVMNSKFKTIDECIKTYPQETQQVLQKIRKIIKDEVPQEATEAIKYGIPTFILNGNLIHFSGYKKHVGLYPTPSVIDHFKNELKGYKTSKGAIQFPLDKPIPYDLIKKIVKYRISQVQLASGS